MPYAAPVTTQYRPVPGQVVLVEHAEGGTGDSTGLVGAGDGDGFEIDLGLGSALSAEREGVIVSVCARDGLYRLKATSSRGAGDGIIVLSEIEEIDRIQRRTSTRLPIRLGVTLACLDEPTSRIGGVTGFTIDLGVGGVQVQTMRPLPDGDPTVMLVLPDGTIVTALALVLQTTAVAGGFRSRLSFHDLPADAMIALRALTAETYPATSP